MMIASDGRILFLEPEALHTLRSTGKLRNPERASGAVFRDIEGIDERVWEHLIYCAQMWRMIQLARYESDDAISHQRRIEP